MHHRKRRSDANSREQSRERSRGSRANGTDAEAQKKTRFSRRALSDELGYASGDGRHRITVDFARDSRHGKYNLQSRAVRVSSARESVHTRASFGKTEKSHPPEPPTNAAPRSPRSRQMVCSIGVMAAREVCPITTPAPRGTSVAKRKRSPHRLRASRGAGRARRARERGRVRGKKRRLRSELYLTNNGRVRESCEPSDPIVIRVVPYVRDARALGPVSDPETCQGTRGAAAAASGVPRRDSVLSAFCFVLKCMAFSRDFM